MRFIDPQTRGWLMSKNGIARFWVLFSFSIDLGSELDSEGYPKMSDDKNLWKSASNCLLGHHIKFLGQSMRIWWRELYEFLPLPPVCVFAL